VGRWLPVPKSLPTSATIPPPTTALWLLPTSTAGGASSTAIELQSTVPGGRPRGNFQGGRGRFQQQQSQPRSQNREFQGRKVQDGENGATSDRDRAEGSGSREKLPEEAATGDKFSQVICYKCGETGHFCSACNKPKVCFICYSKDHVAEDCQDWDKPQLATQYYGSANKGLGFYHIDVAPRAGRFKHWAGFENFGVFTVEEGELSEDEIAHTLRSQIDRDWKWKLLKIDEYRFLVKLPPHIKVESKVLGKATYFYLKNDEVMASLRVWNGDIEPVGQLTEAWV
jgi:hypothetical protein